MMPLEFIAVYVPNVFPIHMSSLRKEFSKFGDNFTHQAKNFSVQENWDNIKNKISSLMDEFIPTRAVASLTVPGGQEFHFPHFFLKF